ncbi:RbsD/FucU family protein [Paraburkholderia hayleyella]|uniref:RbsD/FucU family protein n=1 Tax=Paraburkholderia hayleyella TaxID=2152889 RepID=UPI0012914494|nr:RbsD/FucU domain-containing protein [Paraburkholderia hayleyella]
MLKNLNPLLNADVLHVLRAMGHGDDLVICDANFPGAAVARSTVVGQALRLDGANTVEVLRAVLSVLPLDTFVDCPAWRMEVVGEPDTLPQVQREALIEIEAAEGRAVKLAGLERFAFYERAGKAYGVIVTGEQRGYGCFILRKGVLLARDAPVASR